MNDSAATEVIVDVLIIGGGIAGLWTLASMQKAGYKTVLLESQSLGHGQTRYAQGIIHGGTKYALTGKLTASSEAVADMPSRWRACYEGKGELDLTQAELLSDAHYLWSTKSLTSRISGFFASKVMRSRSTELDRRSLPAIFQHKNFKGQFYRLDEPVFNTMSVVRALAEPRKESILMIDGTTFDVAGADAEKALCVQSQDGKRYQFNYKKIIFTAGQGNEGMLSRFSQAEPKMQLRPLKMVVMRGPNAVLNDMVYAHCLGASVNPRITITSHLDKAGNVVWYMGGQLAEDGVKKSETALIRDAQKELAELIPWLEQGELEWGVINIDRAEIRKEGTARPDSFSIVSEGDLITAWPTKLALSPALADDLVSLIKGEVVPEEDHELPQWQAPIYADFPWNEKQVWQHRTGSELS